MQQPWRPQNTFATDYQNIGSYVPTSDPMYNPNPSLYAQRPSNTMYPPSSYNRSPAPFTSPHAPQPLSQSDLSYSQPPATFQSHSQPIGSQNQQFYQHHETSFSEQTMDRREQPDMDEDFPTYKELRNVFLNKQREAEAEDRSVPARKSWRPPPSAKVAPPTARKPQPHSFSQVPQLRTSSMNIQQQAPQPPQQPPPQWQQNQSRRDQFTPSANQVPQYTEIPIQHSSRVAVRPTQLHSQPVLQSPQQEMSYRPPMSINVTSQPTFTTYDKPSPRVVITSNSPKSPQKAMYRPDGEEGYIMPLPRRHSVSITPRMPLMSSTANQPRRRTSYAEIMMTGAPSSLPRNFSMRSPGVSQRTFSQVTTNYTTSGGQEAEEPEVYPSFDELKQQFRRKERYDQTQPQSFGATYGRGGNRSNSNGFTRVNVTTGSSANMEPSPGGSSESDG